MCINQFIAIMDVRLGLVPMKVEAYINNDQLSPGRGVYSREEWGQRRLKGYNRAGENLIELSSDEKFLSRCFGLEFRKFITGVRLTKAYDFSSARHLMEIGCGEMITAYAVSLALPGVKLTALDYDPVIIKAMGRLPVLKHIEKKTMDINALTPACLSGIDVVFGVDVFYTLDDAQITDFFHCIKISRAKLIIASSQIIGPLRYFSFHFKNFLKKTRDSSYVKMEKKGLIRGHGWKRSIGHYQRLAGLCGLKARLIDTPSLETWHADTYSFILVE